MRERLGEAGIRVVQTLYLSRPMRYPTEIRAFGGAITSHTTPYQQSLVPDEARAHAETPYPLCQSRLPPLIGSLSAVFPTTGSRIRGPHPG